MSFVDGFIVVYFEATDMVLEENINKVTIREFTSEGGNLSAPQGNNKRKKKPQLAPPEATDMVSDENIKRVTMTKVALPIADITRKESQSKPEALHCLSAALCLWAGVLEVTASSDSVRACVQAADAYLPRLCCDRPHLRTWAACVNQHLTHSQADFVVMVISLTFVVCAHSTNHRKRQVDTTQLLPCMTAAEWRAVFSSYERGHIWYIDSQGTASGQQVTDVYQEYQLQDQICWQDKASVDRMTRVHNLASWLTTLPDGCSWVQFCTKIGTREGPFNLWILGGGLMQLHAASAFELIGVVKSAPREWIPPKPKASLELYRMACGLDGFSSAGITLPQFKCYLDKLSQDSGCTMSALENMCCKLKVSASVNGHWPWPNGPEPRCKHTRASAATRVPLVFKLEQNIPMQPNVGEAATGRWPWSADPKLLTTSPTCFRIPLELEEEVAPELEEDRVHGAGIPFDPSEAKHWSIPMLEPTRLPNGSWVVKDQDPLETVAAVGGPVRCSQLQSVLVNIWQSCFEPGDHWQNMFHHTDSNGLEVRDDLRWQCLLQDCREDAAELCKSGGLLHKSICDYLDQARLDGYTSRKNVQLAFASVIRSVAAGNCQAVEAAVQRFHRDNSTIIYSELGRTHSGFITGSQGRLLRVWSLDGAGWRLLWCPAFSITIIHGRWVHSGFGTPACSVDAYVIFVYILVDKHPKRGFIEMGKEQKTYRESVLYILETLTDNIDGEDKGTLTWPKRHIGDCSQCVDKCIVLHRCSKRPSCGAMMCFDCLDLHKHQVTLIIMGICGMEVA